MKQTGTTFNTKNNITVYTKQLMEHTINAVLLKTCVLKQTEASMVLSVKTKQQAKQL